jgi:hypothetical protein
LFGSLLAFLLTVLFLWTSSMAPATWNDNRTGFVLRSQVSLFYGQKGIAFRAWSVRLCSAVDYCFIRLLHRKKTSGELMC